MFYTYMLSCFYFMTLAAYREADKNLVLSKLNADLRVIPRGQELCYAGDTGFLLAKYL